MVEGAKEAVAALNRYARTQSESDFLRYQQAIAVPLGDRRAREELDRPEPNYAIARQGFIDGRNNPEDIDGMIMLFRRFRHVNYMELAIGTWAKADGDIRLLEDAASRLHTLVQGGNTRPGGVAAHARRDLRHQCAADAARGLVLLHAG